MDRNRKVQDQPDRDTLLGLVKEVRRSIRGAGGLATYNRVRRDLERRGIASAYISDAITFMEESREILILLGRDVEGTSGPQIYYASQARLEEGR